MSITIKLQIVAQERLLALFNQAISSPWLRKVKRTLVMPSLCYKQRGKIAASAHLQKNIININAALFYQNTDYFIDQVIAHELAHILVYQSYRKRVKPHGIEWQGIMHEVFNLEAKVTHNLDVSEVALKCFTYKCNCNSVELSIIRHNKVQRGTQHYVCRKCKSKLAWQG